MGRRQTLLPLHYGNEVRNRMRKRHNFLLFPLGFVVIVLLSAGLLPQAVWAEDCSSDAAVPMSGNLQISTSCAFPNSVDGIDTGTGTNPNTAALSFSTSSVTLTVSADQTLAVGSIDTSTNASIVTISGGQIKPGTPLWMTDADDDGYPSSSTQIAQATTPIGGKRRNAFNLFVNKSNRTYDYNDADAAVYPGAACNGVCSVNNTDGSCGAKSAGKYGLATCTACNGASLSAVNIAAASDTYNDCTASYNACSGNNRIGPDGNCDGAGACNTTGQSSACSTASTCQTGGGCSAGSCVTVSNNANNTDPNNECTITYTGCSNSTTRSGIGANCNGAGACKTGTQACPTHYYCSAGSCYDGGYSCDAGIPLSNGTSCNTICATYYGHGCAGISYTNCPCCGPDPGNSCSNGGVGFPCFCYNY